LIELAVCVVRIADSDVGITRAPVKLLDGADDASLVPITQTQAPRRNPRVTEWVLRICAGLGVIVGLFWGLHHEPRVACSARGTAAAAINRCTTNSITAIGTHWGIALGGGLLLGGMVGVIVALLLRVRTE
jgi:hypothetical protein